MRHTMINERADEFHGIAILEGPSERHANTPRLQCSTIQRSLTRLALAMPQWCPRWGIERGNSLVRNVWAPRRNIRPLIVVSVRGDKH